MLWQAFSLVMVSFPASTDPAPQDMNYTAAVAGGWILLCLAYFFCPKYGGMYWFEGPRANIEAASNSAPETESVSVDEKRSDM